MERESPHHNKDPSSKLKLCCQIFYLWILIRGIRLCFQLVLLQIPVVWLYPQCLLWYFHTHTHTHTHRLLLSCSLCSFSGLIQINSKLQAASFSAHLPHQHLTFPLWFHAMGTDETPKTLIWKHTPTLLMSWLKTWWDGVLWRGTYFLHCF